MCDAWGVLQAVGTAGAKARRQEWTGGFQEQHRGWCGWTSPTRVRVAGERGPDDVLVVTGRPSTMITGVWGGEALQTNQHTCPPGPVSNPAFQKSQGGLPWWRSG